MMHYWLSTPDATAEIETNKDGIVIVTAPVWKTWLGVPIREMLKWMWNKYEALPFGSEPKVLQFKRLGV